MHTLLLVIIGLIFNVAMLGNAVAAWDKQSETAFLALMCSSDSYFLKCFDMTREKCKTDLNKSVNECRDSVEIAKFTKKSRATGHPTTRPLTEKEDIDLHAKIGLCAGLKVEKLWSDRKAASQECRKRENWQ